MNEKNELEIVFKDEEGVSGVIWQRVAAFLSTKAPSTRETYIYIVKEWCEFLGINFGSSEGARGFLSASSLDALRFIRWLERRPGLKVRGWRSKEEAKEVEESRLYPSQLKRTKVYVRDGLHPTQSNNTIGKKVTALRRIYRELVKAGLLSVNPFDSVPTPKRQSGMKRPTEMVSYGVIKEILDSVDISNSKGRRDKGILALLFGAGLRRSEIIKLRLEDFRVSEAGTPYLYLRATKAGKDAYQAIPEWAAKVLTTVIEDRLKQGASSEGFIFNSYRGRKGLTPTEHPISSSGIYKLFIRYCRLAGVEGRVSPHSARATAITRLLDQGFSHRDVLLFSRHSSVQMVELYDKRRSTVDENPAKELKY
ncbi:MAG: hypothetical protein D6780_02555 [Candidatus Dadabacteria bacterium]|nr:MAG: hypothetical protein D6780_02555 [Candidatus Dadabacteria bacterium]